MKRILAVFIVIILTGCVQKQLAISGQFDEVIIPITVPTSFKYSPGRVSNLNIETTNDLNGSVIYEKIVSDMKISNSGKQLMLQVVVNELKIDRKTYRSDIPIYECQIRSNEKGVVEAFDMSFPALMRAGKDILPGSPQYDQMKKNALNQMTHFEEGEIVSGDVLYYINPDAFGELKLVNPSDQIGAILLGYSYYNSQKVVVGKLSHSNIGLVTPEGEKITLDLRGYNMFDAQTMLPVNGELIADLIVMKAGVRGQISIKMGQ